MVGSIGRQPAIQTAATSEISNLSDATGLRRSAKLHRALTRPAHPAHRRDGLQAAGLHTCSRPPLAGPGRCSAHCSPSSQSCPKRGLAADGTYSGCSVRASGHSSAYRILGAWPGSCTVPSVLANSCPISVATRILFDQDPSCCHLFARILQGLCAAFVEVC
jgi:hypothetical protein